MGVYMVQKETVLKIAEAFQQDVGYGRVRIDNQTRLNLDLSIGDVIEIEGIKTTAADVAAIRTDLIARIQVLDEPDKIRTIKNEDLLEDLKKDLDAVDNLIRQPEFMDLMNKRSKPTEVKTNRVTQFPAK
ncbi:MAG: hypothetical protein MUO82_01190, partial [Candidatus Thermoplasmatota archaeon]|nr:hypothetical protein [Candidatus Thermoplasmatota archaeon]